MTPRRWLTALFALALNGLVCCAAWAVIYLPGDPIQVNEALAEGCCQVSVTIVTVEAGTSAHLFIFDPPDPEDRCCWDTDRVCETGQYVDDPLTCKWEFFDGQMPGVLWGCDVARPFSVPGKCLVRVTVDDSPLYDEPPVTDSLNVSVVLADLDIEGVLDAQEEDPGGYVWLNDDDDDADEITDKDDPEVTGGDNDLLHLIMERVCGGTDTPPGFLRITWNEQDKIDVFETNTKVKWDPLTQQWVSSEIQSGQEYQSPSPSQFPKDLYVEGDQPSTEARDIHITLQYVEAHNGVEHVCSQDPSRLTVVPMVDLDINNVLDAEETTVGGFVALNDDDDDGNDTTDKDQNGPIAGEDDLLELYIAYKPDGLNVGEIKVEAPAGAAKVKVWTTPTKGTEVALPATWDLSTQQPPSTLYVEGYQTSSGVRDVTVRLSYSVGGQTNAQDELKVTVTDVDLKEVCFSGANYYDVRLDDDTDDYSGTLAGQLLASRR